jgi:outer membrane protein assembly complex protein YaeT
VRTAQIPFRIKEVRVRVWRLLAISTIAVVAIVITAVLVLHTNAVQSRLLNWSIAELERRFSLDLTADDLHYNLARRRVTLTNVRLAAIGNHDHPFFAAQSVTVQLPWVAYRGRLAFDDIAIDQGRVLIYRDKNGVSNLPRGGKPRDPNLPPRRIDVRGLTVSTLDFTYRDEQRDIEVLAPKVKTDLAYVLGDGASGPFEIRDDLIVRFGARRVVVAPVKGNAVFDGSNLELANVALKTKEGAIAVNGEITRVLDLPTLDLTLAGTIDIERAALWAPPPVRVTGAATLKGTMKGAPTAFVMNSVVDAPAAEVGHERGVRLQAISELSPNSLKVSKAILHPRTGGEVVTSVEFPFGKSTPWWLIANYTGIDAATAFRLAEVDPLPFGAALRGTARLDGRPGQPFKLEVHNTSTPRSARGTAPLAGDIEFVVDGNRWRARQEHRLGATSARGTIGGVWNRQAVSRSTFEGRLDVRSANIGDATRTAALFGLTTPALVRDINGPMDAVVNMSGTFTSPRFVGHATTPGVEVPSLGRAAFAADFDASERAVNVTNIDGTVGTAHVKGDVLANLVSRKLDGKLAIEAPSARDLLAALPEALRLEGPLAATATFSGTVDDPFIAADVVGSGMTLGGQPVDTLSASAHLIGDEVILDALSLTQGTGGLKAIGKYSISKRTYTVEVQGEGLHWDGALAQLGNANAVVALKFSGTGTIDRPMGEGTIDFDLTGGLAGSLIGRGSAKVRLDGTHALVTTIIPSLGASIDAKIATAKPFAYDAIVVANKLDLEQVIRLTGFREGYVTGTASLNATASGTLTDAANSKVFINLQEVDAAVEGVPVKTAGASRLTWEGGALTVDTLDLAVGKAGRLFATGRLAPGDVADAKFDASYKGELGELIRIGRPFGVPPELQASGPVVITWRSIGGLDRSTGTVQLAGGSVTWSNLPTVSDLSVDATFNGSTLEVTRLSGRWQGGGIEGTASIPRGVLEGRTGAAASAPGLPAEALAKAGFAKLRVVGLGEQAFAPWVAPSTLKSIGAHVSATLDATITSASLDGVSGQLTLDEANFIVAGVPITQTRPSRFSIQGGTVTAQDVVWSFGGFAAAVPGAAQTGIPGGGELTLTGSARFAPSDKAELDLTLKGDADLRILSAFAPTVAVEGFAKVNVGIGGPPSAPVFSGRVDVADAEVLIREPRIVLGDLKGTVAFDGRRVLFDSFTGTANGGALVLDGGFLLSGARPVGGALTMQMQGAALEYPRGLQSESDALLILRPDDTGWSLTGDVIVARSVFNQPISIAALAAARQTRAPKPPGEPRSLDELHLNVFLTTQEDLRVDNNYARLEAGAAVRVTGSAEEPGIGGRVTLREGGEVYLAGRTFHVTRGDISFTNPNRVEPEFDIELQTRVSGTDITLTLSGPLDRLQTEVRSSDPTIDSREAMAMIFGNLAGEDAVTLLSAELLGATGRAIGLDTLRVERGFESDEFRADPGLIATETDPSTRLTLSKRLRPDVEVTLSQSLKESGGLTTLLTYRPRRNLELRFVARDNLDRSVALRHEITFGGSQVAQSTRPPQPEVAAITFSGELGRPEQELRDTLSLDVGEELDFYTWQRDIDRIRDLYQDDDYYEVRIRGTRTPGEDGRLALNYNVVRGPRAELVIVGHPIEKSLEDELRDSWRRTIFDRFLIEDIQSRIRRHLVSEDIVGSTVEAVVADSTPDRKQVRVTVAAGTQVASRSLQYSGNATFDAGDLDAVIKEAVVDVDAWLEPQRAADALESFYRNQGFLEADVAAGEPRVSGNAATLPIEITEGRRFVLEAIEFPGAHGDRVVGAARAANLELGMPYVTTDLEAARRRIEDYYAALGFNTVDIEIEPQPDNTEAVVDVTFAVKEGPQQIVREVTTQGEVNTREGVIRRALRIAPGDVVNLAQWSQSRKRLYDTNVFRQVDIEPIPIEPTADEKAAGVQPVRAVVRVIEYPLWRFRYGLQFNDERTSLENDPVEERQQNLGVLADLRNQNLFGRAFTAGIAARYERDRRSESVFISNASFFGLPLRSNAFIFDSRQRFRIDQEITDISDRRGLSFEQRWRPSMRGEITYGYRYERNHTFDPTPPADDLFPGGTTVNVSKLTTAALLDRRDDPFEPTRGWFTSVNWDAAVPFLGSDYRTTKMLVQQLYFMPFDRLVLATRAQLGIEFSSDTLLFSERFFLGGATTVRGYGENTLGPFDEVLEEPAGGDGLVLLNAEVRFPVRGWVQGVAFVDAGNVFIGKRDLSVTNLKVGYGIGLRLASPFAMVRADVAFPASEVRTGEPKKTRFYFGIGHIF